jgi:ferritin-like metal-binding protein YciE
VAGRLWLLNIWPTLERIEMKLETLKDLYLEELKDVYDAEHQIIKALPKMAKAASSEALRAAFGQHRELTEGHIERLEEVFERLGVRPKGKKCKGMEGLIEEAKELMSEDAVEDVRDAGLVASAQRVEHYEIAVYGTLRAYAEQLGFDEDADLLQETLDEEKETDQQLSDLAMECINLEAQEEAGGEGEEAPRALSKRSGSRSTARRS